MGHYVEVCALNVSPVYEPYATMTTLEVKQMIETIGAEHCYISTDHFFDKLPSIPEQILIVLAGLSKEGVSYEQLLFLITLPLQKSHLYLQYFQTPQLQNQYVPDAGVQNVRRSVCKV